MPRFTAIRNVLAVFTMAVAALCGGGKAVAAQKGSLSVVEVHSGAVIRSDTRKQRAAVIAVASDAIIIADDIANEVAANVDDRAATDNATLSFNPEWPPLSAGIVAHQYRELSIRFRPPTRAPPMGLRTG